MKQAQFESQRTESWEAFQQLLQPKAHLPKDFGAQYRYICQDLALAKKRGYSAALIHRLNHLAVSGRKVLYAPNDYWLHHLNAFFIHDLPMAIGQKRGLIIWAHLIFYGSAILIGLLTYWTPDFIYSVMPIQAITSLEAMYDPDTFTMGRPAHKDVQMFAYYIYNNIGIGLWVYSAGLLFGVGTIAATLFNGIHIGAAFGHMARLGYTDTFFAFVSGHGAFELTGICLAAAGGMALGHTVMFPGSRSRKDALAITGRESLPLVIGVFIFLTLAAIIEAFWSPSAIPATIKFIVGISLWVLMALYLAYCFWIGHESRSTQP